MLVTAGGCCRCRERDAAGLCGRAADGVGTLTAIPVPVSRVDRRVAGWAMAAAPLVGVLLAAVSGAVLAGALCGRVSAAGRGGGGGRGGVADARSAPGRAGGRGRRVGERGGRGPGARGHEAVRYRPVRVITLVFVVLLRWRRWRRWQRRGRGGGGRAGCRAGVGAAGGHVGVHAAGGVRRPEGLGAFVSGTVPYPALPRSRAWCWPGLGSGRGVRRWLRVWWWRAGAGVGVPSVGRDHR